MAKINITAVLEKVLGTSQIETEEQLDTLIATLRESDEDLLSPAELAELAKALKGEK